MAVKSVNIHKLVRSLIAFEVPKVALACFRENASDLNRYNYIISIYIYIYSLFKSACELNSYSSNIRFGNEYGKSYNFLALTTPPKPHRQSFIYIVVLVFFTSGLAPVKEEPWEWGVLTGELRVNEKLYSRYSVQHHLYKSGARDTNATFNSNAKYLYITLWRFRYNIFW